MLSNIDLDDKGYDRIREEAIARIPLYSKEWTNYNVSDPGITILENFSAFMALQQSEINEIPEKIKLRLLALAGFTPKKGKCARAYLLPEHIEMPYLPPACMKLYAQDICFELEQCAVIKDMRLLSVCAGDNLERGQAHYPAALLSSHGVKGGFPLFGEQPTGGETVSFVLRDIPQAGQKVAFYIELAQQFVRNPIEPLTGSLYENPFVEVQWTIKTPKSDTILSVEDETYGFLQSGFVTFSIEEKLYNHLASARAENGYQIQATLLRADYDIAPRIQRICGLLIPTVQRDTQSDVMFLPVKGETVCIRNYLLQRAYGASGYFTIYGKETDGAYHRYFPVEQRGKVVSNRFFQQEYDRDNAIVLTFIENQSLQLEKEIMVVCRNSTLMAHSSLGRLYGYDEQEFALPDFGEISMQDFSILVVEKTIDGDEICHMVKPDNLSATEVHYSVSEQEHKLIVHDCGRYEGAMLSLGNFAFYKGDGGNIRAGTKLVAFCTDNVSDLKFLNSTDIDQTSHTAGRFAESLEQVRRRFAEDFTRPITLVTEADYMQVLQNIPGLSIRKIGVCPVPERNEIHIAVMPNSTAAFPRLSDIYRREISRYLERCRMLTTKIVLEPPVYVPIHVKGTILMKKHSVYNREQVAEQIKQTLTKLLDGIHSNVPFGSRVVFYDLYRCLESMDCVEEVVELSVFPQHYHWAQKDGLDIQLHANALYFPGNLQIQTVG